MTPSKLCNGSPQGGHFLSAGLRHTESRGELTVCSYPVISPKLCTPVVLNDCEGIRMEGEGKEVRCDGVQIIKLLGSIRSKLLEVWNQFDQTILIFVVKCAFREQAVSFISYLLRALCLVTPSPANIQGMCNNKK